ncbi:hypothetical protein HHI36_016808 [Cryptolaemus montrouzieri]|uniref:Uncharacterized protein n=1 Tax=Cryptolaemus montrouzieri TaxID=559131 RepID=A0ABD2NKV8_9CUCU
MANTRAQAKYQLELDKRGNPIFDPPLNCTEISAFKRSGRISRSPSRDSSLNDLTSAITPFEDESIENITDEGSISLESRVDVRQTPSPKLLPELPETTPRGLSPIPTLSNYTNSNQPHKLNILSLHHPLQYVTIMNVTIANSLAKAKTTATPSYLWPSTFNPCTGNAEAFFRQYERTCATNGWDYAPKTWLFRSIPRAVTPSENKSVEDITDEGGISLEARVDARQTPSPKLLAEPLKTSPCSPSPISTLSNYTNSNQLPEHNILVPHHQLQSNTIMNVTMLNSLARAKTAATRSYLWPSTFNSCTGNAESFLR